MEQYHSYKLSACVTYNLKEYGTQLSIVHLGPGQVEHKH